MSQFKAHGSQVQNPANKRKAVGSRWVLFVTHMVEHSGFPSIEGYEILRELGQGGMATVYLARHLRLDRYEALKVLNPLLAADQEVAQRFLAEARTGAALNHPSIVQTFSISSPGQNPPFIASQYIDGPDLQEILVEKGNLESSAAMEILKGPASALDYAHRLGVIHRDVKPGNILVKVEGQRLRGFLADFGIAFSLSSVGSDRLTKAGILLGTPAFMSPETVNGESVVPQSDQYSFALVVYEALLGAGPFATGEAATPARLLVAQSIHPPRDPREMDSGFPDKGADVLLKALSKKPQDRFASCSEFLEQLEMNLDGWTFSPICQREALSESPTEDAGSQTCQSSDSGPLMPSAGAALTSLGWTPPAFQEEKAQSAATEESESGGFEEEAHQEGPGVRLEAAEPLVGGAPPPSEPPHHEFTPAGTAGEGETSSKRVGTRRKPLLVVLAFLGIAIGASFIAFALGGAFAEPEIDPPRIIPKDSSPLEPKPEAVKNAPAPPVEKPPAPVKPAKSTRTRTTKRRKQPSARKKTPPQIGSKAWQDEIQRKDKRELEETARKMGRERAEEAAKRKAAREDSE